MAKRCQRCFQIDRDASGLFLNSLPISVCITWVQVTPPMKALLCILALIPGAQSSASGVASIDYAREIKPLLRDRCYACHGALKQKAGLRLDTGAAIRRGGK